jgi:hypothetical protein
MNHPRLGGSHLLFSTFGFLVWTLGWVTQGPFLFSYVFYICYKGYLDRNLCFGCIKILYYVVYLVVFFTWKFLAIF